MLEQEIAQLERDIAKVKENIAKIDRGEYLGKNTFRDIQIENMNISIPDLISILNELKDDDSYTGQPLHIDVDAIGYWYYKITESKDNALLRRDTLNQMLLRDDSKLQSFIEIENRMKEKELWATLF